MLSNHYDLIIVGFGPTGATLANLMGQYGWNVAVIEQETEIYPHPRAVHGDDETLRIFQAIGLLDHIQPDLAFFTQMQLASRIGKPILTIEVGKTTGDYGFGTDFWFHQPTLEQSLREGCKRFSTITTFLGWRAIKLTQTTEQVFLKIEREGTIQHLSATYLVGCDGTNSFVRKALTIDFEDLHFRQRWLVVDAYWEYEPPKNWQPIHQQICDPQQPITFVPSTQQHYRWEFMLSDSTTSNDPVEISKSLLPLLALEKSVKIARRAIYTFEARLAKQWNSKRIFLAGDAAHQTPPFLGQGMCAGIRDAHNLAWKLHFLLKGMQSSNLISSYQTERYPHVKKLIKGAIILGAIIQTQQPMIASIRNLILRILSKLPALVKLIQNQIVKKEKLRNGFFGGNHPSLAGSLFIQPQVQDGQQGLVLLDELLGHEFALLCFQPLPRYALQNLGDNFPMRILNIDFEHDLGQQIHDYQQQLGKWFRKHHVDFVILRPDRHIYDAGTIAAFPSVLQSFSKPFNL
ncbi:MAG: bifunctional 3-(3-hydroxy-phenyl)propionate/3-hydroxycinnamic acid hydroxylase [Flammeovirgaceae bacterium]